MKFTFYLLTSGSEIEKDTIRAKDRKEAIDKFYEKYAALDWTREEIEENVKES